jgi:hypothetical protein
MGMEHIEAFSDSLLVMQQIAGVFQCFDGSLNAHPDKCLKIIAFFDDFTVQHMQHIFKDENTVANDFVQQASGFRSNGGKFGFLKNPNVPIFC